MPFPTASPNNSMKPMEAGTLKYCPLSHSDTTPPIKAKGRLRMIRVAYRNEWKAQNRRKNTRPSVIGTTIINRALARSIFSNAPPHTTVYPSGK